MSEVKYDSVLAGYAEDPRYNEEQQLMGWSVRFKDHELKDILDKYVTSRNEKGEGGNVYFTLFMAKNGKPCCRVFDPNSAAAKEKRAAKQAQAEVVADDMPF